MDGLKILGASVARSVRSSLSSTIAKALVENPQAPCGSVFTSVMRGFSEVMELSEDDVNQVVDQVHSILVEEKSSRCREVADNKVDLDKVVRKAAYLPADRVGSFTNEQLLARRRQVLPSRLRLFFDPEPAQMVQGRGQWLIDADGKRYLDCYNNVVSIGHCHPRIVAALSRQARQLNTNTRYLCHNSVRYAERIRATLHPSLDTVVFVNSGSEANDLAIRIAHHVTGRKGGVTVRHGYHGISESVTAFTPAIVRTDPRVPDFMRMMDPPDSYREPNEERWVESARNAFRTGDIACVLVDSLFMSNGVLNPPSSYFRALRDSAKEEGVIYVADEVQSGFGRTGEHMWGHARHGIVPDIVTIGKPAGNGHPIGIVVTRRDLMDRFNEKYGFFSTFGGNNVSSEVGIAVLDVFEDERLLDNCRVVGKHFLDGLTRLKDKYSIIGDVRGIGLAIGVEIVKDRATKEPAEQECLQLIRILRHNGVIAGTDGEFNNCVKLRPPLVVTKDDIDFAVNAFDKSFAELVEKKY